MAPLRPVRSAAVEDFAVDIRLRSGKLLGEPRRKESSSPPQSKRGDLSGVTRTGRAGNDPKLAMGRAVAAAFDAGRPTAALARVDAGISHAVFQLRTTTGRYAAKRLNVVAEQWWWDTYRAAARIEQAASADGVSMPDRLPPLVAVLDLDGARQHWQLHRWCDGPNPTEPADDLADWTGATLALLHRRGGDDEPTARPALYPIESWYGWLEGHDTDVTREIRRQLPTVAAALEHLGRPGPPLTPVASTATSNPTTSCSPPLGQSCSTGTAPARTAPSTNSCAQRPQLCKIATVVPGHGHARWRLSHR